MQRIGIFGGTFNPVHNVHLKMAESFLKQMKLDFCVFVPAYVSPFKIDNKDDENASHRVKMLELALSDYPKFAMDKYEIDKRGISYTVDTLRYFKSKYSDAELFFLIGSDQIKDFQRWKDWQEILSLVKLCIVKRPDFQYDIDFFKEEGEIFFIDFLESDVSSTRIRNMVRESVGIEGVLPEAVEKYIRVNHLYIDD